MGRECQTLALRVAGMDCADEIALIDRWRMAGLAVATRRQKKRMWIVRRRRLDLYDVIPTFSPAHFGRVYAAYGGFFIVLFLSLSLLSADVRIAPCSGYSLSC
jgi:drug/metabolite transporter superfamily protein YnfA